ncbi:MAG: hypothetical protein LN409_02525 [Candidatus Thermoplasmatota archaeon]|nr:hypothetical protein [Candidatus Thermoplasmatota archaeon]
MILAIVGVAVVAIFGMRRRGKMADSLPVIKDPVSAVSQSYDGSDPAWPPEPPSVEGEPGGPGDGDLPPSSK